MPANASADTRKAYALKIFENTHKILRASALGRFPGSPRQWLDEHRPDLVIAIDNAEAAVDQAALDYIQGRVADEAAFKAAGKAWFGAWKVATASLPALIPPSTPAALAPVLKADPCTACGRTNWISTVVNTDGSRMCAECLAGHLQSTQP